MTRRRRQALSLQRGSSRRYTRRPTGKIYVDYFIFGAWLMASVIRERHEVTCSLFNGRNG